MPSITSCPLVWLIDDDESFARDVMAYWRHLAPQRLRFRYFRQAQEAWKVWEQTTTLERPDAMIVDGHLDSDSGDLAFGAGLIHRVRAANSLSSHTSGISLIGFSGDDLALEDMEDAGANSIFSKSEARQVLAYLLTIPLRRVTSPLIAPRF